MARSPPVFESIDSAELHGETRTDTATPTQPRASARANTITDIHTLTHPPETQTGLRICRHPVRRLGSSSAAVFSNEAQRCTKHVKRCQAGL